MKKLTVVLGISLCMSSAAYAVVSTPATEPVIEWKNIIEAIKQVSIDQEVVQAGKESVTALQKMLVLGAQKITRKLSSSEKAKLTALIKIVKRIIDKYETVILAGDFSEVDEKTQDEINKLGQQLIMLGMPVLLLMQDPNFAATSGKFLENMRIGAYRNIVKHTIDQLSQELK